MKSAMTYSIAKQVIVPGIYDAGVQLHSHNRLSLLLIFQSNNFINIVYLKFIIV